MEIKKVIKDVEVRLCSDHLFGVEKNRSKTAKWTFAAMHSGEKPNNCFQLFIN